VDRIMVTEHLDNVMRVLIGCYNDDIKISKQLETLSYDELISLDRFVDKLSVHRWDAQIGNSNNKVNYEEY